MRKVSYKISSESILVMIDGESYSASADHDNYTKVKAAIAAGEWDKVPGLCVIGRGLAEWAKSPFAYRNGKMFYGDFEIPYGLTARMKALADSGQDPTPWMRFWAKLMQNPSYRSVRQLFAFLKNNDIAISVSGDIIGYKYVTADFKDAYTKTFLNAPGYFNEMPRNMVSDESENSCDHGFHVGSIRYVQNYASADFAIVLVGVNPRDVVRVPADNKMGVCRYVLLKEWSRSEALPADVIVDIDVDEAFAKAKPGMPSAPVVELEELPESAVEVEGGEVLLDAPEAPEAPETVSTDLDDQKIPSMNLGELRKYATQLGVPRASKIPGGRAALIEAIKAHQAQSKE